MNEQRPGGEVRIGDQEREDAVRRLGEHYEAGRLSADEHTERVGEALQAKTGADLGALFADLPGEHQAGSAGTSGPASTSGGSGQEQWAGPWGWTRPPWTAAESGGPASGGAAAGGGAGGRPPWAAKGPFGRIPFPLLVALGVLGVLLSIGCVVGGGHPPILPLLLIVAGVIIYKKRRQEHRA
ncbi:putative secreted protein with PEP-CTERM sorting signal [Kribbella amoyensis]|uniref:Putative secreted protein with PEP-CTERM sorting signal n=1 Tax=Kribbella amoyensis TaxID=996641 RepID=A0A561BTV4_9ACTN|nr:DUF1707 domain-containing protein [Kribbella amoyensis]TWD82305.1 putative secreted protein with PEP-CTERM sorting signal [Kribbella amoyensis]